jgi:hypothetical protein
MVGTTNMSMATMSRAWFLRRILLSHLPDETPDLGPRGRAAGQRPLAPEEAERTAVPADHGLRLDQNQGVLPAAPMTEEEGPEGPVPARERQSSGTRPFQYPELVPESQNLSRQGCTRAKGSH